jgi:hypothetical protein
MVLVVDSGAAEFPLLALGPTVEPELALGRVEDALRAVELGLL